MNLIKSFLILFSIIFFMSSTVYADRPVTWGEVPQEHWDLEQFEDDDESTAIILVHYGESYLDRSYDTLLRVHFRVKILDPDDSRYTEFSVRYFRVNRANVIQNLRAQTLNQNPDGSIRSSQVRSRDINTERDGDWEITKFAFQDVVPGSIVEVSYTVRSNNPFGISGWRFQNDVPTLHSEYRVLAPGRLRYRPILRGFHPWARQVVLENTPGNITYNDREYTAGSTYYEYLVTNAPAVKSEPFTTAMSNYRNSVEFFLISYQMANGGMYPLVTSWGQVAESLFSSDNFGRQLRANRNIRRTTNELIENITSMNDAVEVIYNYVAQGIVWEGGFSRFPANGVSSTFDQKRGNSADKALLLTVMLQESDIEALPVLVSTRNNGRVLWDAPRATYFNHIIVQVKMPDGMLYLDPSSKYIPMGMLHPQSLNGGGLVIDGREAQMIEIHPDLASSRQVNAIISIDENNDAITQLQLRYNGYNAIDQRVIFENQEENEQEIDEYFMNAVFTGLSNVDIQNYRTINLDNTASPFELRMLVSMTDYVSQIEDMLYVNPFVGNFRQRNPFRNPTRQIPIEFNYGIQQNYTATISVPEGYRVYELPQNGTVRFGNNNVYTVQFADMGSSVQVSSRYLRSDTWIEASQYNNLKSFFTDIENLSNNQIVFKKIHDNIETISDSE